MDDALSGPTAMTPRVARAIEPPPAPISTRSIAWMFMGSPLPAALFTRCSSTAVVVCGRPSSMSASFAAVPPMSKAIRSRWPVSSP